MNIKDKLSVSTGFKYNYTGYIDKIIRLIERVQLCDEELWSIFVNQFREHRDDCDKGWRSEYWGKMMRGASLTYKYTKSRKLYDILEKTVRELLDSSDDEGRISGYSKDMEFQGWDLWGRKYVLLGLQYFCEICQDKKLVEEIIFAMRAQLDYIIERIGNKSDGKIPITDTSSYWEGANSSSILEPTVKLYNMTGDIKYLDFARYIVENGGIASGNVFELAYEGKLAPYQYPVVKAYELMSCFEGLLDYYRATGIEKYKTAVINYVNLIMETDITVIGCGGCTHELFDNSAERQTDAENKELMQETCVTVTWIKLCLQALRLTGDARYADCMEKSIYNALFGAVNTEGRSENGGFPFDSYSPLIMRKRGVLLAGDKKITEDRHYGCCVSIGSAGTGLIAPVSIMEAEDGKVFNFYINGTAETEDVRFDIETAYPKEGACKIKVTPKKPDKFAVYLRIPSWSRNTKLSVNGVAQEVHKGYTRINRVWEKGDEINIIFDMRARLEERGEAVAVLTGPLVLARDARLKEDIGERVNIKADSEGYVKAVPFKAPFETVVAYEVCGIHMVDYSSAGKTWNDDSMVTVWMKK